MKKIIQIKFQLESRKVFAKVKTLAGSNDYFGNLVIFKIYELNYVRFAVYTKVEWQFSPIRVITNSFILEPIYYPAKYYIMYDQTTMC